MTYLKGLLIGFLCIVCFVFGVIFNVQFLKQENSTRGFVFSDELSVSNTIKPESFVSNPSFAASANISTKESLSANEKANLMKNFNEIIAEIKKSSLCVGGSYSIEPTFLYKDGVQIVKGQRFDASLECKIKENELQAYNELINTIDKIANEGGFFTMNIPALRAEISSEQSQKNEAFLKQELIKKALESASAYSQLTQKNCSLQRLEFATNSHYVPVFKSALSVGASQNADFESALPAVNERTQSKNANATYICK